MDENHLIVLAILGFAFVVSLAVNIKQLLAKETPQPQPFLVKMDEAFVKKEDFEALKTDMHNQIKEMRNYIHGEIHALNNTQDAVSLNSQLGFEKLRAFIDGKFDDLDKKRSVSVARLHEEVGGVRDRVSAAEQLADSLNQGLHAANQRIDALRRARG